jgi:hypothetical protein
MTPTHYPTIPIRCLLPWCIQCVQQLVSAGVLESRTALARLCGVRLSQAGVRAQVTLQFLSEPLRQLPLALIEEACDGMHLEQYDQHNVLYSAGDEPSHYYVCLAGAHAAGGCARFVSAVDQL